MDLSSSQELVYSGEGGEAANENPNPKLKLKSENSLEEILEKDKIQYLENVFYDATQKAIQQLKLEKFLNLSENKPKISQILHKKQKKNQIKGNLTCNFCLQVKSNLNSANCNVLEFAKLIIQNLPDSWSPSFSLPGFINFTSPFPISVYDTRFKLPPPPSSVASSLRSSLSLSPSHSFDVCFPFPSPFPLCCFYPFPFFPPFLLSLSFPSPFLFPSPFPFPPLLKGSLSRLVCLFILILSFFIQIYPFEPIVELPRNYTRTCSPSPGIPFSPQGISVSFLSFARIRLSSYFLFFVPSLPTFLPLL